MRVGGDGARQRHAARHAAREVVRHHARARRAGRRRAASSARCAAPAPRAASKFSRIGKAMFSYTERSVNRPPGLEHHAHLAGAARRAPREPSWCTFWPYTFTVPPRRLQLAADQLEQRRLARAARAEDRHHLAARDREREAAEHLQVAVGEAQPGNFDDVGVRHGGQFYRWTSTLTHALTPDIGSRRGGRGGPASGWASAGPQQLREPRLPGRARRQLRRRRQVLPSRPLERRADRRGARLRARARRARESRSSRRCTRCTHADFRFAIYPRRGGRPPELDNPKTLEWIGRFIARIHAVGATRSHSSIAKP